MDVLQANPAFRSYALCAGILGLKMLGSAVYTGSRRQRHQGYINSEDAREFGGSGVAASDTEVGEVAHALRVQRNDLENIPLFFAVGLVYVLMGASHFWTALYCWTFTLARLAHTYFYVNHLQPGRARSYIVGAAVTALMILQIVWWAI